MELIQFDKYISIGIVYTPQSCCCQHTPKKTKKQKKLKKKQKKLKKKMHKLQNDKNWLSDIIDGYDIERGNLKTEIRNLKSKVAILQLSKKAKESNEKIIVNKK